VVPGPQPPSNLVMIFSWKMQTSQQSRGPELLIPVGLFDDGSRNVVKLLGVGLKVKCRSTRVVGMVGTTEAADVHQVRSGMSHLRMSEDLVVKYSSIFVWL